MTPGHLHIKSVAAWVGLALLGWVGLPCLQQVHPYEQKTKGSPNLSVYIGGGGGGGGNRTFFSPTFPGSFILFLLLHVTCY